VSFVDDGSSFGGGWSFRAAAIGFVPGAHHPALSRSIIMLSHQILPDFHTETDCTRQRVPWSASARHTASRGCYDNSMTTLRWLFFLVAVLSAWDFATPVLPIAEGVDWDEEEDATSGSRRFLARPGIEQHAVPEKPMQDRSAAARFRSLSRRTRPPERDQQSLAPPPRARNEAAAVDSPSEDH
jgi:hypothetical protein